MSIYAIGDIQGCYDALRRLLDFISFDPDQDQLWLAGDLVNRGPHSLETLRFVKSLGAAAVTVLGNHDLHLLVSAAHPHKGSKKDTLQPLLQAEDADELLFWLRQQPLFYHDQQFCMLHAGLPPQWDFEQTKNRAREAEALLKSDDYQEFFKIMYGNQPTIWRDDLAQIERIRFAINCFTRMRFCSLAGELDFNYKGAPGSQPEHLQPWYALPQRKSLDMRIIFGHWSTLGFYQGYNCFSIDTGCLWGGQLTALKLGDTPERFSIDCAAMHDPLHFN